MKMSNTQINNDSQFEVRALPDRVEGWTSVLERKMTGRAASRLKAAEASAQSRAQLIHEVMTAVSQGQAVLDAERFIDMGDPQMEDLPVPKFDPRLDDEFYAHQLVGVGLKGPQRLIDVGYPPFRARKVFKRMVMLEQSRREEKPVVVEPVVRHAKISYATYADSEVEVPSNPNRLEKPPNARQEKPVRNKMVKNHLGGNFGDEHAFRGSYDNGEVATRWRVGPVRAGTTRVRKPTAGRFSVSAFRRWVYGEAAECLRMLGRSLKPYEYVSGNLACQTLFYTPPQGKGVELLDKAAVFVTSYKDPEFRSRNMYLHLGNMFYHREGVRVLFVYGRAYFDAASMPLSVRAQAPIYRQAQRFFAGELDRDARAVERLWDSLADFFPAVEGFDIVEQITGTSKGDFKTLATGYLDAAKKNMPMRVETREQLQCKFSMSHLLHVDEVKVMHKFELPEFALLAPGVRKTLVSIFSFLSAVVTSNSWPNRLAILVLFANNVPAVWDFCGQRIQVLKELFEKKFVGLSRRQAGDDPTPGFWTVLAECSVVTLITEFASSLSSMVLPLVSTLVKETRLSVVKLTGKELALALIAWVTDVFGRLRECYEKGSMDPIWGRKWNPKKWLIEAAALKNYQTLLTINPNGAPGVLDDLKRLREDGTLSPSWTQPVQQTEYLDIIQDHLEQGDRLLDYFKDQAVTVRELTRMVADLRDFYARLRVTATAMNARPVPFCLYLFGPPGVGKTMMCQQIVHAIAHRHSYDATAAGVYQWGNNRNFQDGLSNQWCIQMDDVDQSTAPPSGGQTSYVEEFSALVNNKPYSSEQADVDRKGLVFVHPLLMMVMSNFVNFRAPEFSLEPHVIYRRINFHVTVCVKEEFSSVPITELNKFGLLDKEKARKAGTNDMFTLEVREYRQNPTDKGSFLGPPRLMSFPQFMKFVQHQYTVHLQAQLDVLAIQAGIGPRCPDCGLTMEIGVKCPCSRVLRQCKWIHRSQTRESFWEHSAENRAKVVSFVHGAVISERCTGLEFLCYYESCHPRGDKWELADVVDHAANERVRRLIAIVEQNANQVSCHTLDPPSMGRRWLSRAAESALVAARNAGDWATGKYLVTDDMDKFQQVFIRMYHTAVVAMGVEMVLIGLAATYRTWLMTEEERIAAGGKKPIWEQLWKEEPQLREANATEGLVPHGWVRTEQKYEANIPSGFGPVTFTREDLLRCLSESYVTVVNRAHSVNLEGKVVAVAGHGFCLTHNSVLLVSHAGTEGQTVVITQRGREIKVVLTPFNFTKLAHPELAILIVPGLMGTTGILGKMQLCDEALIQSYDAIEVWTDRLLYSPTQNQIKMAHGHNVLMINTATVDGDCGALYIAKWNDHWKIVGMHYSVTNVLGINKVTGQETIISQSGTAALLSALEMRRKLASMGERPDPVFQMRLQMARAPEQLTATTYTHNSEVWAVMSQKETRITPLGRVVPALGGSTMKTKLKRSIFYDEPEIRALELEFCGEEGYWRFPEFRGGMNPDTGKWSSPYTNMWANQLVDSAVDEQYSRLALFDYLSGINKLDCSGYSHLSEAQALLGVPGSTINAVNMKSSAGPPFNTGKRHHVDLHAEGGPWMSPEVASLIDEIETCITDGIPSPFGNCTLKDEAVKPGKMPRVFVCLSMAFNLVLKRYTAPIKAFFRNNPKFFESYVGINMTSVDINILVSELMTIDPELRRIYTTDTRTMDKAHGPKTLDIFAMVYYCVAYVLLLDALRVWRLAMGIKHVTYNIKNDIFREFHNPSGGDPTTEVNGVAKSWGERYVWYRTQGFKGDWAVINQWYVSFFDNPVPPETAGLTFREDNALGTFGDDDIKTSRVPYSENYAEIWRHEIGFILTDEKTKTEAKIEPQPLSEAQFLKRTFVWDPELEYYLCPLDKKSLARLLLIKKDSSLGDLDHGAVVLSEYLREAVYHGEEFYNAARALAQTLSERKQLTSNPYLVIKDYEYWRDELRRGVFQTWNNRSAVPRVQDLFEDDQYLTFSPQMSNVHLVEGADSAPVAVEATSLVVSHDVGEITATTTALTSTNEEAPVFLQTFADVPLNNFLTRPVQIGLFDLTTTDGSGAIIYSVNPWSAYLAVPSVANKVSNYTYIRGTMQVILYVTVPAGAYGRYVVVALPNGGDTALVENAPDGYTCLGGDHWAMIDVATSTSVVLQLPWAANRDVMTGTDVADMWTISVLCLAKCKTSIPGGATNGMVKVFASLTDDYTLVVPHFQMKATTGTKSHAPKVHKKLESGSASGKVAKVGAVLGSLGKVPVIGSFATAASGIAQAGSDILSIFGFTRRAEESTPMPLTCRSVSNVAHMDGGDASDVAALSCANALSISADANGFSNEDCLAQSAFCGRWGFVAHTTWSPSQPEDTILANIPVSPSYCHSDTHEAGRVYHFIPAGYYGLPFSYWRGTMEYLVVIPVSKFHRGAIQVIWVPDGSSPGEDDVTNTSMNVIYDVADNKDHIFSVGFSRDLPAISNRIVGDLDGGIVPTGAFNGFLTLKVINPLVSQSTTAAVEVWVFARAGADMQFGVPRDVVAAVSAPDTAANFILRTRTILQMGAIGDSETVEPVTHVLVPPAPYPADTMLFGESVNSVRALLQKPSTLGVYTFTGTNVLVPKLGLMPGYDNGSDVLPCWTWQAHYRAPYLGFAASERWKVLPAEDSWAGAAALSASATSQAAVVKTLVATTMPVTFCGMNKGAEFTVPYYMNRKYLPGGGVEDVSVETFYNVLMVRKGAGGGAIQALLYHSFGPDIRATCFRQVPAVVFTTTPAGQPGWFT